MFFVRFSHPVTEWKKCFRRYFFSNFASPAPPTAPSGSIIFISTLVPPTQAPYFGDADGIDDPERTAQRLSLQLQRNGACNNHFVIRTDNMAAEDPRRPLHKSFLNGARPPGSAALPRRRESAPTRIRATIRFLRIPQLPPSSLLRGTAGCPVPWNPLFGTPVVLPEVLARRRRLYPNGPGKSYLTMRIARYARDHVPSSGYVYVHRNEIFDRGDATWSFVSSLRLACGNVKFAALRNRAFGEESEGLPADVPRNLNYTFGGESKTRGSVEKPGICCQGRSTWQGTRHFLFGSTSCIGEPLRKSPNWFFTYFPLCPIIPSEYRG